MTGDRFDKKGFLIIPDPKSITEKEPRKKILVVKECYCPNGHNLMDDQVKFNGHPGIRHKIRKSTGEEGQIVLSPVYGEYVRVEIGVDVAPGNVNTILCPECNVEFPTIDRCTCGKGEIKAIFLDKEASFQDSIGICNVIDCFNSKIFSYGEAISYKMLEAL
ncbi:MAG: hypothetical protein ACE5OR_05285 [bacterium]